VFYTLLFSLLAVLLVVAGVMAFSRNRRALDAESAAAPHTSDSARQQRKARRTQSKQARRKRH